MPVETIQLRARDGRTVQATAEVKRYGAMQRLLRGGGTTLAFTVVGLCTIVVPGVHLILPWMLPLLGIGIGLYIARVALWVGEIKGECPDCNKEMVIPPSGSVADEALWVRCPHCTVPLELVRETP